MKISKVIFLSLLLIFIIIAVSLGILLLIKSSSYKSPITTSGNIQLFSQVKGYNLILNDKSKLEAILSEEKIFENGVYIGSTNNIKPKKVTIVLSSTPQNKLVIAWPSSNGNVNGVSSDYSFDDFSSNLIITIFIMSGNQGLNNVSIRNNLFNNELIATLISMSTNSKNNSLTVPDVLNLARNLMNKYTPKGSMDFPIRIN